MKASFYFLFIIFVVEFTVTIHMIFKLKTYNYALMATFIMLLSSCVKHELYDIEHQDKGALVVTADFSSRSAEANVPASYFIALSSGEEWGEDAIVNEVQGTTNVFGKLLEPMTYNMLVYNQPDGITINGTTATVNSVQTKSRASSIQIEATPDYLFGAFRQVSIAEDDTTWVTVKMKQYVKLINLKFNIKEGDKDRIASVDCSIDGVQLSIDLATGILSDYSAFVSNEMIVGDDKLTTNFRVLGVVTSEKQILSITITYTDGTEETIEEDISDIIDGINDEEGNDGETPSIDIDADISLPLEPEFSATIDGWHQANGNGITAK